MKRKADLPLSLHALPHPALQHFPLNLMVQSIIGLCHRVQQAPVQAQTRQIHTGARYNQVCLERLLGNPWKDGDCEALNDIRTQMLSRDSAKIWIPFGRPDFRFRKHALDVDLATLKLSTNGGSHPIK